MIIFCSLLGFSVLIQVPFENDQCCPLLGFQVFLKRVMFNNDSEWQVVAEDRGMLVGMLSDGILEVLEHRHAGIRVLVLQSPQDLHHVFSFGAGGGAGGTISTMTIFVPHWV